MASRAASEDTEITLGTGKLLGLFFLLAAVCGVFFAIGYSLGKSSAREQALHDQAASSSEVMTGSQAVKKPPAAVALKSEQPPKDEAAAHPQDNLTFYKSVQQDQPNTQLTQPQQQHPATTRLGPAATTPAPQATSEPVVTTAAAPANSSGDAGLEAEHPTSGIDRGAYMVQIAAVSKQEDAQALAAALKKKSYSVFVVTNPAGTDKLFRVQVGPFASLPDAEAMKAYETRGPVVHLTAGQKVSVQVPLINDSDVAEK